MARGWAGVVNGRHPNKETAMSFRKMLGVIAVAGAGLAVPGAAHAADRGVAIAQPDVAHLHLLALSAQPRAGHPGEFQVQSQVYVIGKLSEQWKERNLGGGNFRYESMRYAGTCLQVKSG